MATTEAEQNRLIIENAGLAANIAADFRGIKSIPFDELRAQAMLELVVAARRCREPKTFGAYAKDRVRGGLKNYIDSWQRGTPLEEAGVLNERADFFHEWTCWQFAAPYEAWDNLAASPEEIKLLFEGVERKQAAFNASFGALEPRLKKLIWARFFRRPQQTFNSIARENKISYARTVELISNALKKMRKEILAYERNRRQKTNVIVFPARAVRTRKKSDRPSYRGQ